MKWTQWMGNPTPYWRRRPSRTRSCPLGRKRFRRRRPRPLSWSFVATGPAMGPAPYAAAAFPCAWSTPRRPQQAR